MDAVKWVALGVIGAVLGWLVVRQLDIHVAPRMDKKREERRERREVKRQLEAEKKLLADMAFRENCNAASLDPSFAVAYLGGLEHFVQLFFTMFIGMGLFSLGTVILFSPSLGANMLIPFGVTFAVIIVIGRAWRMASHRYLLASSAVRFLVLERQHGYTNTEEPPTTPE